MKTWAMGMEMKIFMDRTAGSYQVTLYIHVQLGHDIGHLCDQLLCHLPLAV